MRDNPYQTNPQYSYVEKQLQHYMEMANGYRIKVVHITSAGNKRGEKTRKRTIGTKEAFVVFQS